jgi:hypothetical protein
VLDNVLFLAAYAGLSVVAVLVLHWLVARERRGMTTPPDGAGPARA